MIIRMIAGMIARVIARMTAICGCATAVRIVQRTVAWTVTTVHRSQIVVLLDARRPAANDLLYPVNIGHQPWVGKLSGSCSMVHKV